MRKGREGSREARVTKCFVQSQVPKSSVERRDKLILGRRYFFLSQNFVSLPLQRIFGLRPQDYFLYESDPIFGGLTLDGDEEIFTPSSEIPPLFPPFLPLFFRSLLALSCPSAGPILDSAPPHFVPSS